MSNEARVTCNLQITKGNLQHRSFPTAFLCDVVGTNGPTPGALLATTVGVDVDLSLLTTPGLCRLSNLDSTNYVIWGLHDGVDFYPLGEILPGEFYVIRLFRYLGGIGTGTGGTVSLHIRADTDDCNVLVDAFEA